MKKKIIPLDWMRGISALFIVLFHFTTQYELMIGHDPKWSINFPYGSLAVVIFFLLSGFLTVFQIKDGENPVKFAIKRFLRLYPTYWVCILITTLVTVLFMPTLAKPLKTILINLSMLQSFLNVESVDGVYWTLAYELRFYLYIFIVLLIKKERHLSIFLFAWLIIAISSICIPDQGIFHYYKSGIELVFMSSRAAQFACGGFIALLLTDKKNYLCYCGIVLCILLQILIGGEGELIFLICGAMILVLGILLSKRIEESKKKWPKAIMLSHNAISFLATISYPLYLLHQYIGRTITYHLQLAGFGGEEYIFIPMAIVLLLAWYVHRFVEKPITKVSNRLLSKL